jgi:hypothetical protein
MGSTGLVLGSTGFGAEATEAMKLQHGSMGGVLIDADRSDRLQAPQVGLHRLAVDPHPARVVTGRIVQLTGRGGLPLDVAVQQGNPHRRDAIDAEPLAQGPDQRAGNVRRPAPGSNGCRAAGSAHHRLVGGERNRPRHGQPTEEQSDAQQVSQASHGNQAQAARRSGDAKPNQTRHSV